MIRSRRDSLLAALLALGCGHAASPPSATPTSANVSDEARELAPDLAARVDQAHQAIADASDGDPQAQRDRADALRMWRLALDAEVQRIRDERAREPLLRAIEAWETERAQWESERMALEQQTRRALAAQVARAEAARVLAEAEPDEARLRGGDSVRAEGRLEASRALLDRAEASLAAALAMGSDPTHARAASEAIASARRTLDGSAVSMRAAQDAFAATMRALGSARAQQPGPSRQETDALLEALTALGLNGEVSDEGVVVWIAGLFAAGRAELKPAGAALLESLAAVLTSHPRGPVHAAAPVPPTLPRSMGKRRTERVRAVLSTLLGARAVAVEQSGGGGDHDNLARIVLPAYVCSTAWTAGRCNASNEAAASP